MNNNHIDIITLGCSKNLVDSERLIRKLEAKGYQCTHDSKHPSGNIAVINTCGFIGDAKEESKGKYRRWTNITGSSTLKNLSMSWMMFLEK